jgi:NarL family two-component system sensor histidine kinase YdfH
MVVFALMLLAMLGFIALRDARDLGAQRIVLLVVLSALHGGLHWRFLRFRSPGYALVLGYLGVQLSLTAALGWLSRSPMLTLGLVCGLVGEAVSTLPRLWAAGAIAVLLGVPILHFWILGSLSSVSLVVSASVSVLMVVFYVEMFMRQARAREQAQTTLHDLHSAHEQLAAYADQVEQLTRVTERQRMARDLHDTLTQKLVGLALQFDALDVRLERGDYENVRTILKRARETVQEALVEARETIAGLRAPSKLPLREAILAQLERFQEATGIPCETSLDEVVSAAPDHEVHVMRFVGESLANCARHARASHVWLSLSRRQQQMVLEVRDDGVGFVPADVETQAGRYGLLGLRERARLAGGRLAVESAPGAGTRLRLELPVRRGGW